MFRFYAPLVQILAMTCAWCPAGCITQQTRTVLRFADPAQVEVEAVDGKATLAKLPAGRTPGVVSQSISSTGVSFRLAREADGSVSIGSNTALEPDGSLELVLQPSPSNPANPTFGLARVDGRVRATVPLVHTAVEGLRTEYYNGRPMLVANWVTKSAGASVVFASAESNAVDVRTYTGPSRAAGWAWLLGGAASGGFGFYLAGKADSAPNEETRDDVKTLSYGFLGLGAAAASLAVYLFAVPHEEKVVATFANASGR